jgi:hypothetical protein
MNSIGNKLSKEEKRKLYMERYNKMYEEKNSEILKTKRKEYRLKNKEKIKNYIKNYRENNKNTIKIQQKKYFQKNKEKRKEYVNFKYANDLEFMLKKKIRSRFTEILNKKNIKKTTKTLDLIGCSVEELKTHIESQFKKGMTWENYGLYGWHIDHIKPCASFDLTDPVQQKLCFHYTNLQPLWAKDNWEKKDKIIP